MASWGETPRKATRTDEEPFKRSLITILPGVSDPMQRDACEHGAPPPASDPAGEADPANHALPSRGVEPDASRDPLLDLEVDRILRLVDELNDYQRIMGRFAHGLFHQVPRATFDALNAYAQHHVPADHDCDEFWAKYVRTPAGHTLQVFCNEPPEAAS